ncbi:hypothetical protein BEH94_10245 [Candidatus Altiarchaeales archaeon WOR_SM1_SCG]|nr:hypothetical protein BEH94_10245 [Candidatus Altiarchaeales archaeon WOR_SM1_SCG]
MYLKKVGRQNQWWTDDVYEQKKLARKSVEVKKENLELKEENKQQGNEIFELKKENEELKKQILELKLQSSFATLTTLSPSFIRIIRTPIVFLPITLILLASILITMSGNTPDECPFETFVSKDFLV